MQIGKLFPAPKSKVKFDNFYKFDKFDAPAVHNQSSGQPDKNTMDKDQHIIKALTNITEILVDMKKDKNKNKTKNNLKKIPVDNNTDRMKKHNKDIIRTNKLSNNLASQLDSIGYTEDKDNNNNRNFLKVMMENITKLEQKIKQIKTTVDKQNNTIIDNRKTIDELKEQL